MASESFRTTSRKVSEATRCSGVADGSLIGEGVVTGSTIAGVCVGNGGGVGDAVAGDMADGAEDGFDSVSAAVEDLSNSLGVWFGTFFVGTASSQALKAISK